MRFVLLTFIAVTVTLVPRPVMADTSDAEMREVLKIAKGIAAVQPFLPSAKYISYGIGIHRAATRYNIHPALLISITQQESGFRADLPEGAAGEVGICQILKSWLSHGQLRKEFGKLSVADLKRPAISFQIAAWILKDLQDRTPNNALPFWSFYNSPNFKHRLKYYERVSEKMLAIKRHAPEVYAEGLVIGKRTLSSLKRAAEAGVKLPASKTRKTAGTFIREPIANSRSLKIAFNRNQKGNPLTGGDNETLHD